MNEDSQGLVSRQPLGLFAFLATEAAMLHCLNAHFVPIKDEG